MPCVPAQCQVMSYHKLLCSNTLEGQLKSCCSDTPVLSAALYVGMSMYGISGLHVDEI